MRCLRLSPNFAIFLGLLLISGCGGETLAPVKLPTTVPESGTVKLDGKPLVGARVIFMTTADKSYEAAGVTNDQGVYELSVNIGSQHVVGAAPGNYNVRISRFLAPDGTPQDASKPQEIPGMESIPSRYSDLAVTTLKATVSAAGGTQDFDLKSK